MNAEPEDRLSSMMLWNGADDYLKAARTLFGQEEPSVLPMPPNAPVYFLVCQAIELVLKAYLRGSGQSENFLASKCNHDLLQAWKAAKKNGLTKFFQLEREECRSLCLVNRLYRSKALQFAVAGVYRYPSFECLLQIAERLVAKTEVFCMENVERHTGKPTAVVALRTTRKK